MRTPGHKYAHACTHVHLHMYIIYTHVCIDAFMSVYVYILITYTDMLIRVCIFPVCIRYSTHATMVFYAIMQPDVEGRVDLAEM